MAQAKRKIRKVYVGFYCEKKVLDYFNRQVTSELNFSTVLREALKKQKMLEEEQAVGRQ